MGYFDPVTQRRVENADELVILPVAETLPALHPGGIEGLARELDGLLARQRRRKTPNEALMRTLQADADALRGGLAFSAADRYRPSSIRSSPAPRTTCPPRRWCSSATTATSAAARSARRRSWA